VSGFSYATSALLGTVRGNELGLPSVKSKEVLGLGREMVEKGQKMKEGDKMALSYISGGWALIGGFISLGRKFIQYAVYKKTPEVLIDATFSKSLCKMVRKAKPRLFSMNQITVHCNHHHS
jgi:hypothetical protein